MFPSLAFLSSFFSFFLFFFVRVSISQRSQLISMSVNVKSFKKGLQIDFFSSGGTRVLSDSTGSSGDPWYCYPSHGFSNIYFSWTSQWDLHIKAAHSYLIGKKGSKNPASLDFYLRLMSYSWEKLKFEQHYSILLFFQWWGSKKFQLEFSFFSPFIVIYSLFVLQKPFKMFWWMKSQYFLGVLMYLALIIQYVCLWAGVWYH